MPLPRPRGRAYVAPVPEPAGRTDQGVDWGTRPGEYVRAIGAGVVDFVGRYAGFGNYVAYHLTEGPAKGQEIYTAEHAQTLVKPGQRLRRGQAVGRASSGLEVGFAQRGGTYLPLAQVEGGYSEGEVTAAGRRFRALLGSPNETLEKLWIDAGGNPKLARLMAAIALAESGGRVDAKHENADGSIDYGIWQINSVHAAYDPARLTSDADYNARAAVAVERSQGLGAWTTYTSGAYRSYLERAAGAGVVGGVAPGTPPRTRPGGDAPSTDAAQLAAWQDYLNPTEPFGPLGPALGFKPLLSTFSDAANAVSDVSSFLKWVAWIFHPRNLLRITEFTAGLGLMGLGLWTSIKTLEGSSSPPAPVKRANVVTRAVKLSPAGRAVSVRSAARAGRRQAREQRHLSEREEARKRARKSESTRAANRSFERKARKGPSEAIPF